MECSANKRHRNTNSGGFAAIILFILAVFLSGDEHRVSGQQGVPDSPSRSLNRIILNDLEWQVSIDEQSSWKPIKIPGTIEDQIAPDFDGVSWYRSQTTLDALEISQAVQSGFPIELCFGAVATEATLWVNQTKVGLHLGGWTPFRFSVDGILQDALKAKESKVEILIRCDEKIGHNTQGFLPVIAPHFGGIWKSIWLEVPTKSFQRDLPRLKENEFEIQPIGRDKISIRGRVQSHDNDADLSLSVKADFLETEFSLIKDGRNPIQDNNNTILDQTGRFQVQVAVDPKLAKEWSTDNPSLHTIKILLKVKKDGTELGQVIQRRVGFRDFETDEHQFKLNGDPIQIRGVLNWGYAPPRVAPSLDEAFMRREIEFAKARGFNMMKFCLWIPPKRYLELCDEIGMLAWIEYPTWHPKLTPEFLEDLKREYDEFFSYVAPHPSVVLHSLTCETGPSADIRVIRSLYDQCKSKIPGAVVEDDSSWISWNRVHDFYDDHPYGNNHTWVSTLTNLKDYISSRKSKPLILGEAIAADTWLPSGSDTNLPPHLEPWFAESNKDWIANIAPEFSSDFDESRLARDSHRYAMLMRKYQIETYRREVPDGGYVVSVIRDFPKASMGLIDFNDRAKTNPKDWSFQQDAMLLLRTENDRRSFNNDVGGSIILSIVGGHPEKMTGSSGKKAKLILTLKSDENQYTASIYKKLIVPFEFSATDQSDATVAQKVEFSFNELADVQQPTRLTLTALCQLGDIAVENQWPIWCFPKNVLPANREVLVHDSFDVNLVHPGLKKFQKFDASAESIDHDRSVVFTRIVNDRILQYANRGGRVVLFPDDRANSVPIQSHWFLRGGPVIGDALRTKGFAKSGRDDDFDFLVELQHFDLGGKVVPRIGEFLADGNPMGIQPLVAVWDNHDMRETRTHGLLFGLPVGEAGELWVTTFNHGGPTNAAGHWMLNQLIHDCPSLNSARRAETGKSNFVRLGNELRTADVDLSQSDWKFKPDPNASGEKDKWFAQDLNDKDWSTIKIDRHWESQGFKNLDKWAWYRIEARLPEGWGEDTFLNFTGVDDHYRLYVNGELVGTDGNIETKETAFENRKSWDVSKFCGDDKNVRITVAVYDWYGAGGIFRPVTLSQSPISDSRPFLKK